MKRRSPVATLRATMPTTRRVGVYARQSVEDRTSEFGSLAAQCESVENYVRTQHGNAPVAITRYTDAGFSGGTIDRPEFQRLLGDVRAGKLDEVCIYKIDRLSRSIVDFVGLMELFDKHGVTFRSATQQFSTSDSMGRFSLNMLAMFAQFEREMIAERTRDKMHAARRKGMWTGGAIPLGFDVRDKRLVVNDAEAERVRSIFSIFLAEDSIIATLDVLRERGWVTKTWTTKTGTTTGGLPFTKDSLRALLTNPVVVGKVRLGDETHTGTHEAIVSQEIFDEVQRALGAAHGRATMRNKRSLDAMLRGLLVCARCGSTMTPTFASKRGRRIPYYTCNTIAKQGAKACPASRVAAQAIETAVVDRIRWIGTDASTVESVVAAAHSDHATRLAAATAAVVDHQAHATRIDRERRNILDAIGRGGSTSGVARLAELDAQHADAEARVLAAQVERDRVTRATIDEDELRRVLADFDAVWSALFPRERGRVLALLIDHVTFDGTSGEVAITFHASEVVA